MSGLSQNPAAPTCSSIHPLVPLLLYSDRHFPPSSPLTQPISTSSAAHPGDAHPGTHPCYQGNGVSSGRQVVKKPLNAFMLYMKEMRHKVLQEGRERESAAINRILGRRWHALSHSEQSKYYDLAQKERLLHMQLYPGWSARDNYGKRKRKRSQPASGKHSRSLSFHQLRSLISRHVRPQPPPSLVPPPSTILYLCLQNDGSATGHENTMGTVVWTFLSRKLKMMFHHVLD
ncbi:hypothetical protein INR49_008361, partial [Caranx melampygus]